MFYIKLCSFTRCSFTILPGLYPVILSILIFITFLFLLLSRLGASSVALELCVFLPSTSFCIALCSTSSCALTHSSFATLLVPVPFVFVMGSCSSLGLLAQFVFVFNMYFLLLSYNHISAWRKSTGNRNNLCFLSTPCPSTTVLYTPKLHHEPIIWECAQCGTCPRK